MGIGLPPSTERPFPATPCRATFCGSAARPDCTPGGCSTGCVLGAAGKLIVGADGLHSTVARQVDAAAYAVHPTLTFVYYAYWSGIRPRRASFHARSGRLVLVWPTNNELTCVYVLAAPGIPPV